jgi:hypothetical protein
MKTAFALAVLLVLTMAATQADAAVTCGPTAKTGPGEVQITISTDQPGGLVPGIATLENVTATYNPPPDCAGAPVCVVTVTADGPAPHSWEREFGDGVDSKNCQVTDADGLAVTLQTVEVE